MSRGEAVGLIVACFVAILGAGLSTLGWYVNRRVAAWFALSSRLAAVEASQAGLEAKIGLVDVGGTVGNRAQIDQLRKDVDTLEALHRHDVADIGQRMATAALGQAQLAERLNSYTWGRRTDERRPTSGHT